MERGNLDIMKLKETTWTEACSNNRRGYGVGCAAARPSSAGGAQGGVGLGLRNRPNRWRGESTQFHGMNMVSYVRGRKVSEVDSV